MTRNEKISVIKAKERIWVGFAFLVCIIYYILRVTSIALIDKQCFLDEAPLLCNQESSYLTIIIVANISFYLFLLLLLLKSSYMI